MSGISNKSLGAVDYVTANLLASTLFFKVLIEIIEPPPVFSISRGIPSMQRRHAGAPVEAPSSGPPQKFNPKGPPLLSMYL